MRFNLSPSCWTIGLDPAGAPGRQGSSGSGGGAGVLPDGPAHHLEGHELGQEWLDRAEKALAPDCRLHMDPLNHTKHAINNSTLTKIQFRMKFKLIHHWADILWKYVRSTSIWKKTDVAILHKTFWLAGPRHKTFWLAGPKHKIFWLAGPRQAYEIDNCSRKKLDN